MNSRYFNCAVAALTCLTALTACPPPPVPCEDTEEGCSDGGLPPDLCNSRDEALSLAECHLTVNDATGTQRTEGRFISRLADGGVDKDWYLAQMPANVSGRSLLHVNAGYSVSQTAVNLGVNVLKVAADGGLVSIATGVDNHGAAPPRPVDIVVPFAEPNAQLFISVGDQSAGSVAHVDNVSPYSVLVQVLENPDTNEPNDTTPTPIALSAAASGQQGMQTGVLATPNDVDLFSFTVAGGGRQIVYVHITEMAPVPTSPPPYRLSFALFDPMMNQIAEGLMDNRFLAFDLATARLATTAGTYTVRIQGNKDTPNATVDGNLEAKYLINVQVMPDLDLLEPNDTLPTAHAVSMSPNSSTALRGKLSYVADEEWFVINLPARPSPSVVRYRTTVATTGARFAPLSLLPARQLRFVSKVTQGATVGDRLNSCLRDNTACPKGYLKRDDFSESQSMLVDAICRSNLGDNEPYCLYAERDEAVLFDNLKNLVGAVPVPANRATQVYVVFRDQGQGLKKYADDLDWTIDLSWQDDADEAARGGNATQVALGASSTNASGVLSFGYGEYFPVGGWDINQGDGIRGPEDYDAVPDEDLFQFNLASTTDQSWEIVWDIGKNDAGQIPGKVAFEMTFCNAGGDGGLCPGAVTFFFGDTERAVSPWYAPPDLAHASMLFERQENASTVTMTAKPVGCWCINGGRASAGRFYANVLAYDRVSNDPINYTLRYRTSAYPGSYTSDGGANATCPVVDGGCAWLPAP